MSINLSRDVANIQKEGGRLWAIIETDSTGSMGSNNWVDGVYRAKTDFERKSKKDIIYDESGTKVKTVVSDSDTTLKISTLQADSKLEKFLQTGVDGKYFGIIMGAGKDDESNNKFRYMPICQISSDYKESAPGRSIEISIDVLNNDVAVTPSKLPTWITVSTGSLVVPINQGWIVSTQSGSIIL